MTIKILEYFKPILIRDNKYKLFVYHGGRGGGKSMGIADSIIISCLQNKEYAYCGREIQKSNDDSTAMMMKQRLDYWGEQGEISKSFFKAYNDKIEFKNGSFIKFVGFSDITIDNMKSTGASLIYIDEAHSLSKNTIDTLIPSVRVNNSKGEQPILIFSFNRQLINDPIYVEAKSRTDCYLKKINYIDNPYFKTNIALNSELEQDNIRVSTGTMTESEFNHRWLGEPFVDEEVLITYDLIKKCQNFKCLDDSLYIPMMGLDIAREGKDASVLTILQGHKILEQIEFRNKDGFALSNEVINYYNYYNNKETTYNKNKIRIFYDLTGIGCSFRDAMKQLNYSYCIVGIEGAGAPEDSRYFNKRAECYGRLKEAMIDGLEFQSQHNELIEQLAYIPIDLNKDKIKLVDKRIIKQKLGRSPDNADSLSLCYSNMVNRLRQNNNNNIFTNSTRQIKKNLTNADLTKCW